MFSHGASGIAELGLRTEVLLCTPVVSMEVHATDVLDKAFAGPPKQQSLQVWYHGPLEGPCSGVSLCDFVHLTFEDF